MTIRRVRFTLRELLIAVVGICVLCYIVARFMLPYTSDERYYQIIEWAAGRVREDSHGDLCVTLTPQWDPPRRGRKWLPLLADLQRWPRITALEVDENFGAGPIGDAEFNEICRYPRLTWLSINAAHISDAAFSNIVQLKNLRALHLDCPVDGHMLSCLSGLACLDELGIHSSELSPGTLSAITKLRGLTTVILRYTPASDDDLIAIASLPQLKVLNVEGSKISDAGLLHLSNAYCLEVVDADMTKVTASGADALRSVARFRNIKVRDGKGELHD